MALKFTVDSLEGLPPEVAALYTRTESGKYRLSVEGAVGEEDVAGLKANAEKLLREKKILEGKQGTEFDIEEFKRLRANEEKRAAEEKEREEELARKRGEFEKLEKARIEQHEKELKAEREARLAAEQRYQESARKRAATDALSAAGAKKPAKLLPHLLPHLALSAGENGEEEVLVREDKDGFKIGKGGRYMTPSEFVSTVLREEYPEDFNGSSSSGGGAAGDGGRPAPGGAVTISKAQAANTRDYSAAKANAEKLGVPLVVEG